MFFPPFFKYHVLFQAQGYMSEDDIIVMIKVIVLKSLNMYRGESRTAATSKMEGVFRDNS